MTLHPTNASRTGRTILHRISIDVTETVATGKWTGIERVVRRLCAELTNAAAQPDIRLVVAIGGRFHALNTSGVKRLMRLGDTPISGARTSGAARAIGAISSRIPALHLIAQSFQKERRFAPILTPLVDRVSATFDAGDVVLLLDSYWAGTSAIAAARHARRNGAAIVSTIYDLIPITHPSYMPRSLTSAFPRRLAEALKISDAAIAISRYSAQELRRWLGARLPDLPIGSFRLGNDPAPDGDRPPRTFEQRYAMIGTIEPRKRHDLVLDAFERRWATGADCHLTIVGRIGWAAPATLTRLATLQESQRLCVVNDANDARMASILAATDAVIMASDIEGFGLPIVEALALNLPVIASDIPIFREVGGEAILPFAAGSSSALVDAMERLEADPESYHRHARAYQWPSWQEASGLFLEEIARLLDARTRRGTASSLD